MDTNSKIYIAGHHGMVGSAITRKLQAEGHTNLVTRTSRQLDLRSQAEVDRFFQTERPEYVFFGGSQSRRHPRQQYLPGRIPLR